MPGPKPTPINLSIPQQNILEKIIRRHHTPQQLLKRCQLILLMAQGYNNQQAANQVGVHQETAKRWRDRWLDSLVMLTPLENDWEDEKQLEKVIREILTDHQRSGAPDQFTAQQITQILALACEQPSNCGRPINRWTNRELADEAQKRKIVNSISPRTVGRFLKTRRNKATQNRILV